MSKGEKVAMKPTLRFPDFLNDDAWTKVKIRDYLKESKVRGSKGNIAKKLTVKLWGKGVFEKKELLHGSENTQYYCRKAGQFIYSKLDFLNQAFGIIPPHLNDYESTVDLPCFDVDEELDVRFLLEYVQRKNFYKQYGEIADGGRKAKRIQAETFLEFPIYMPKLPEQQKIADCLSSLDDLIAAEVKKLEALKAHKKGLMQKLFPDKGKTVPEIRFPGFTDAWEQRKLGEHTKLITKGTTPKDKSGNGEVNFVKVENIANGVITPVTKISIAEHKGYLQRSKLKEADVLFSIAGTLGRTAIVDKSILPANTNQALAIIRGYDFDIDFLLTSLAGKAVASYIRKNPTIGAQPNLSLTQVADLDIWTPEITEQAAIGTLFTALDRLITLHQRKLEFLRVHKKGLMQGLFPSIEEVSE